MTARTKAMLLCLLLLAGGCRSADDEGNGGPGNTEQPERQIRAALRPMVQQVSKAAGSARVSLAGLYDARTGREIPASHYVTPRLQRALTEAGVVLIERSDLHKLVDEQLLQTSDLFDPSAQEKVGRLSGADLTLLCPVSRPDDDHYDVSWKLATIDTGEILDSGLFVIDRRGLPVRYGGR